mgnify:CR=1 FL=1
MAAHGGSAHDAMQDGGGGGGGGGGVGTGSLSEGGGGGVQEGSEGDEGPLLCPICKSNFIHENKSVVFCRCGFRLDFEQDGVGREFLREQLVAAFDMHRSVAIVVMHARAYAFASQ